MRERGSQLHVYFELSKPSHPVRYYVLLPRPYTMMPALSKYCMYAQSKPKQSRVDLRIAHRDSQNHTSRCLPMPMLMPTPAISYKTERKQKQLAQHLHAAAGGTDSPLGAPSVPDSVFASAGAGSALLSATGAGSSAGTSVPSPDASSGATSAPAASASPSA
jgi:hypothetical protein